MIEEHRRDDPKFRAIDKLVFARDVSIAVLRYRTDAGMSQRDLATVLGVSQPQIARLESGESRADGLDPGQAHQGHRVCGSNLQIANGGVELIFA